MSQIQDFLKGKKTHLIVAALIVLNSALGDGGLTGIDPGTLKEDLWLGLVSSIKAKFDRAFPDQPAT